MYLHRLQKVTLGERALTVYLPPSYDQGQAAYPVAYIHDGGKLFMNCLNHLEHLYAAYKLSEVILIGVESANRNDEYTPWPAKELIRTWPDFGGKGPAYVQELADVIKPFIDENYRTLPEREHTAVIGGSFGGLISLFALYWRPDVFGNGGLISASFWYEGVLAYVQEQPLPSTVRVFMSIGKNEGIYKQNIQKNMIPYTMKAHRVFQSALPESELLLVVDPEGTHDTLFMTKQFPAALSWLFERKGRKGQEADIDAGENTLHQIQGTMSFLRSSTRTGRQYRISVTEPMAPPPEGGYPVLYMLDANASFGTFAEANRLQTRRPRGHEPAIIVGIGYDSPDPMVTPDRFIDYTELATLDRMPLRPDGSLWPDNGGAEDFLNFISEQLKPEIEQMYSIHPKRQSLLGHSLGGFFALYAMMTRTELFQQYIAASPSIWWNDQSLYGHLDQWIASRQASHESAEPVGCMICVGAEEKGKMLDGAREMQQALRGYSEHVDVRYLEVEGEGHVSLLPSLVSPILRYVSGHRNT